MSNDKSHNCQVFHFDLYGTREEKYEYLNNHSLSEVDWKELKPEAPYNFFAPKDFSLQEEYEKGFKVDDLFVKYNNGIESGKDEFFYGIDKDYTKFIKKCFADKEYYSKELCFKDTNDFRLLSNFLKATFDEAKIIDVNYRPFDIRQCYYEPAIQRRPAFELMRNMLKENVGLLAPRQVSSEFHHVFVSNKPTNCNLTGTAKKFGSAPLFPLYLYKENLGEEERIVNFNKDLYDSIAKGLNYLPCYDDNMLIDPTSEYNGVLYPQDLFDYIYAALHCPSYRERYKEFLKIDFPRIPYPTNWEKFRDLAEKGEELRKLHLMEDIPSKTGITFPVAGSLQVDCYRWQDNRVYINSEQYFEGVPESAWNFYIGGYQPAQKWLKDRKGMTLCFEDVKHYGNIIYVLQQTEQIMQEIDGIMNDITY